MMDLIESADKTAENPLITAACLTAAITTFNQEQKAFYIEVESSLKKQQAAMFYLDGPGGTGKTFLLNAVIDLCNTSGMNQTVVASSGVCQPL
jgi:chromosomal replication initiation ATPase DnaA